MQSRKDQLQAHYFVVGRLVSAMMRADPDAPQTPMRRFSMGTFTGLVAGLLGIVGFAIFGFFSPGGQKAWKEPGALIVEKETGARYVYLEGELRPLLNHTSGKLILGDDMHVASVSRNSLKGVPHGLPVGIPTAPDFLPDASKLDGRRWQVCAGTTTDATNADHPFVTLRVSSALKPGLPDDKGLIVQGPDKQVYLAWNDKRLRIADRSALAALGFGDAKRLPVGAAWLNALPSGPDLQARRITGIGEPGPQVGARPTRVGQVFVIDSAGNKQHFVVMPDGLAPTSWTDAALLLGHPNAAFAYPGETPQAIPLSAGDFGTTPRSQIPMLTKDFPRASVAAQVPQGAQVPCMQAAIGAKGGAVLRLALDTPPPVKPSDAAAAQQGPAVPPDPATVAAGPDGALADRVVVQPGGGLLAEAQPAPGIKDGTLYLIVDVGVKYPLATADVAKVLGYGDVAPVPIPTNLLALIPTGASLDPAAARLSQPAVPRGRGAPPAVSAESGTQAYTP